MSIFAHIWLAYAYIVAVERENSMTNHRLSKLKVQY